MIRAALRFVVNVLLVAALASLILSALAETCDGCQAYLLS